MPLRTASTGRSRRDIGDRTQFDLRPLAHLKQSRGIDITRVDCDAAGIIRLADVRAAVTPATRLVAVTHASNVTAAIQPIDEIGAIAHDHGALLLVDAAQSVGHVEIDLARSRWICWPPLGTKDCWDRSGRESSTWAWDGSAVDTVSVGRHRDR